MRQYPELSYAMGFMVNGVGIPDPSVFTGAVSDLDTMGERDATGYLHRDMVATKHPLKLEYNNIPWYVMQDIGQSLASDKFSFTYTDPIEGERTMEAYVGDREWEVVSAIPGEVPIGTLKFSVIEY